MNREGHGSNAIDGEQPGHSDHGMTSFPVLGELRRGPSELPLWTITGQILAFLRDWLRDSLGRQSLMAGKLSGRKGPGDTGQ